MAEFSDVKNLRRRYILALSAIALLVTGSWLVMRTTVQKQQNYAQLVSMAAHQSALSNRISLFATQMAISTSDDDFSVARGQLGRAIARMGVAHQTLLHGNVDDDIPRVISPTLKSIYFDPTVGLDGAVKRYLAHARTVYDTPKEKLKQNSASYVFLLQYGPHVLDALFEAATEEYDRIGHEAISWINILENVLLIAALLTLVAEALFIFRPLECKVRTTLGKLTEINGELLWHLNEVRQAREDAEENRERLDQLNRHLEERVAIRTRELGRELDRHERTEARLRASKKDLERANQAKSEFLANMSHELRTPLNAIIGFSNVLYSEVFGPLSGDKQREYVADIHHSGQHLLDLINDILDVSALEAGRIELKEEPVIVRDVIDHTWRLVCSRAEEKGVKLHRQVPNEFPRLHADERRVKQILINLLTNAIKFTPEGGMVNLEAFLTSERAIAFCIVDTGIGMSADEVQQALSMFGQVDSAFTRKEEGTGLGLPLTKGLVELHSGAITIDSRKGRGTRVTVEFPASRTLSKIKVVQLDAHEQGTATSVLANS